jgi:hypothetical protein
VLTDVRDAYTGVESNGRVAKIYVSGVLDEAKLSRDISEYSYRRGATALLDFLVAQRNYDAIELAYRQSVAAYLTSVEQLRQAVGAGAYRDEKAEVRARIEEIGIIPGIRVSTPERARFAAEMVNRAGIPIAEITMTVPRALDVISHLAKTLPDMAVGAGTVLDAETASRCLDAGAMFLTSTGLVPEVVEFALKNDLVVFPGAMTPTDVIAAWKTGADFVKIFPAVPSAVPRTFDL